MVVAELRMSQSLVEKLLWVLGFFVFLWVLGFYGFYEFWGFMVLFSDEPTGTSNRSSSCTGCPNRHRRGTPCYARHARHR